MDVAFVGVVWLLDVVLFPLLDFAASVVVAAEALRAAWALACALALASLFACFFLLFLPCALPLASAAAQGPLGAGLESLDLLELLLLLWDYPDLAGALFTRGCCVLLLGAVSTTG